MNVDEAMEAAKAYRAAHEKDQEPLFYSEGMAVTLAKEVERLRAELELSKANVETLKKALFEVQEAAIRLGDQVDDAKAELAVAKAASVVPVEITRLYSTDWGLSLKVECRTEADCETLWKWLRDKKKERGEG